MQEDIIITEEALDQANERIAQLQESLNKKDEQIKGLTQEREYLKALIKSADSQVAEMKDILNSVKVFVTAALR